MKKLIPKLSLLNGMEYKTAAETDLKASFARIRREQQKAEKKAALQQDVGPQPQSSNITVLRTK